MQNKPNFQKAQINVSSFVTSKYAKMDTWLSGKNKANLLNARNERKLIYNKGLWK